MRYTLHTPRLTLRPIGPEDLESTHAYAGSEENARYMLFLPYKSREQTKQALEQARDWWAMEVPEAYCFAIVHEGRHIGEITLEVPDPASGEGELGWILHRDWWGQGLVPEAGQALLRFAREECALRRLIAHCDARNLPSQRAMEKLGLRFASVSGKRQDHQTGEEVDEHLYTLEWPRSEAE